MLKQAIVLKILAQAKYLVSNDLFNLVPRQNIESRPVSSVVAKVLFSQLRTSDFQSEEQDRDHPNEFVWIFHEEDDDITYYLKVERG